MSKEFYPRTYPLPRWLIRLPESHEKDIAIKRFYLRLAAIYATPNGHIHALAQYMDINERTLLSQMSNHIRTSDKTIEQIRAILAPIPIDELIKIHEAYGL